MRKNNEPKHRMAGLYLLRPIVNDYNPDHGGTNFTQLSDVSKRLTAKYVDMVTMFLNAHGTAYVKGFHLNLNVEADASGRVRKLDIIPELNTELDGMADNPEWPEELQLQSAIRTCLTKQGYPSVTDTPESLNAYYERLLVDVPELTSFIENVPESATEYVLLHVDSKRYVSKTGELTPHDEEAETFRSFGDAMKKSVEYGTKFLTPLRVYARAGSQ